MRAQLASTASSLTKQDVLPLAAQSDEAQGRRQGPEHPAAHLAGVRAARRPPGEPGPRLAQGQRGRQPAGHRGDRAADHAAAGGHGQARRPGGVCRLRRRRAATRTVRQLALDGLADGGKGRQIEAPRRRGSSVSARAGQEPATPGPRPEPAGWPSTSATPAAIARPLESAADASLKACRTRIDAIRDVGLALPPEGLKILLALSSPNPTSWTSV